MIKPYSLVVFDWEGTLGDNLGQIVNALVDGAKKLGFGETSANAARQSLALGLIVAIKKLFSHLSLTQQEQILLVVQDSLSTRDSEVYLIPGALSIVEKLSTRGVNLAIATNRGRQSLQRDLQASGLERFFTTTRTASQAPAKPSPIMLEEIMTECNASPEQTLMIGDSISDIEMAKAVNVDAIGVNFYNSQGQDNELLTAGAMKVFDDYAALEKYLEL